MLWFHHRPPCCRRNETKGVCAGRERERAGYRAEERSRGDVFGWSHGPTWLVMEYESRVESVKEKERVRRKGRVPLRTTNCGRQRWNVGFYMGGRGNVVFGPVSCR